MALPPIYISRQQAETFLAEFTQALNQPSPQPLLLHLYGMGGVGKTTLLQKLKETHQQHADFAEVSFGLTAGIETPMKLMANLYEQLPKPPSLLETDVKDVEVPSDSPPPARYENPDWRKSIAEFLYHTLFAPRSDCQQQFIRQSPPSQTRRTRSLEQSRHCSGELGRIRRSDRQW